MPKRANTCASRRTPPGRSRWSQCRARSGDPPAARPSRRGIGSNSSASTKSSSRAHLSRARLARRGRSPGVASARSRRFAASSGCGSALGRSPRHQVPRRSLCFASLRGRCMWCVPATRLSRSPSAWLPVARFQRSSTPSPTSSTVVRFGPGRCSASLDGQDLSATADGSRSTVR